MKEYIEKKLAGLSGTVSCYYKNLVTGEQVTYHGSEKMKAASVIKLFIMAAAFRQIENGILNPDKVITINKKDYVPSCGALTYMHDGLMVTVMDLITLMIILSDNTATNILADMIGVEAINSSISELGFRYTAFNRNMYDLEKSRKGIQNIITATETGQLLDEMYHGRLISKKASETMVSIMKNQRLNGKIPFYLHSLEHAPEIAHKTGEDIGTTHDVGIIFARQPFILCFCGNETNVPVYERVMAELSLDIYQLNNR